MKEENKLIAEFMGLRHWTNAKGEPYFETGSLPFRIDELRYHTSWDWLMTVVEKIEGMGYVFQISENVAYVGPNKEETPHMGRDGENGSKINAAYMLVIDFITWYNQQSK